MTGLNLQSALVGAVGGALATAAVKAADKRFGPWDPKMKAAAVLATGALLGGIKAIPTAYRKDLATGAQITGATRLLTTMAPGTFGGLYPTDPLSVQIPNFGMPPGPGPGYGPESMAYEPPPPMHGDPWAENI